jgi:AraC-like DNA-binding protein
MSQKNDLHKMYMPLTANPLSYGATYTEIMPCDALKPYIRCFWGSQPSHIFTAHSLVTPDTCMDIIINVNYSKNEFQSVFCGINDQPFVSQTEVTTDIISTFAIRFYAWAVPLFSSNDMKSVSNIFCNSEHYFPTLTKKLEQMVWTFPDLSKQVEHAEVFLLEELNLDRVNMNVMNAVYTMLKNTGNIQMADLSHYTGVSTRQLERLFKLHIGMSPKKLASLIRYQNVWSEVLHHPYINIQDLVHKYGYTDQAHLLNDFKRFHTMTVSKAKEYAWQRKGNK